MPTLHPRHLLLAITLLAPPCRPQTPTLQNDPAHPATTQGWVETELFFGLGPRGSAKNIHTWTRFLDKEVTPRFPSGLSVLDLYGQWQGKNDSHPERINSRLLILVYPDTPENAAGIDALRSAWKQKTGDQSVLKVTRPVDVSF